MSTSNTGQYRVFVSYSHDSRDKFEILCKVLEKDLKLRVLSDRNVGAGTPFTDAIKGLITHAHLFIPLITKEANLKPWVHQETGFAMARNIPILPIVLEDAGIPYDMIAQLQAITVKADLSDLTERLRETSLKTLIFPRPAPPSEMVIVAEWPEERTRLLVDCANRVKDLGYEGMMRQRGAFSSFCLPNEEITEPVWREREGEERRSNYYHSLQRDERQALEWHASKAGCRLIVDPTLRFNDRSLGAIVSRLETLLAFLESPESEKVEIVLSPHAREGNLTIIGEWFVAESIVPGPGGYRQTVFNWHAPTVSRSVERFDEQFEAIARGQKIDFKDSRPIARDRIREIIVKTKAETKIGAEATTLVQNKTVD